MFLNELRFPKTFHISWKGIFIAKRAIKNEIDPYKKVDSNNPIKNIILPIDNIIF